MESLLEKLNGLTLERRSECPPEKVNRNVAIVNDLLRHTPMYCTWNPSDYNTIHTTFLPPESQEHQMIQAGFNNGLHRKIISIRKVQNPYLCVQYHLKLKHKRLFHGFIRERRLYHGTKSCNLDPICRRNFDWRLLGTNGMRSSKFGRGVSFSPSSRYASDYPRRCAEMPRAMIVAKVMEASCCIGVSDMIIPPVPHDTSVKPIDGHVVVKYFDNEFYPEYIVYYN